MSDFVEGPTENYYYLNADVFTKESYPLIKCDASANCKLTAVDAPGYYLNVPAAAGSAATGIKCTSKTSCESYSSETCSNSNIGKISLADKKFCSGGNGVDLSEVKEYLVTVESNAFPGVTTKSNIAVKVDNDKGYRVTLVEKKSACTGDNEIIKKEDGKFYYCTFNTEIEMKDDGAKFVNKNSKNNSYQLIQIKAIGIEALTDETKYVLANEGYYVDRSKGANGLVECKKKVFGAGETDKNQLECKVKSTTGTEVFLNSEKNFVLNQKELSAKLIVCTGGTCEVPENAKYGQNKYFTNSGKGLISCDSNECNEKSPTEETEAKKIAKGYYINGLKDLSLIKCDEVKYKKPGETTDSIKIDCEVTTDNPKYSFYVGSDANLIECNDKKCESKAASTLFEGNDESLEEKTFLNSADRKIIRCKQSEGKCEAVDKPGDYYVDSSQKALVLIKCTTSGANTACAPYDDVKDRDVYISDNGLKLISCDMTECKVIEGSETIDATKFYLNGEKGNVKAIITGQTAAAARRKRDEPATEKWIRKDGEVNDVLLNGNKGDTNKLVIYCVAKNSCSEVEGNYFMDIKNGKIVASSAYTFPVRNVNEEFAYIVDKDTSKIIDVDENISNGKLVVCKKESEDVYKCAVPTTVKNYYINYNTANTNKNLIITTNSNSNFSVVQKGNLQNGYYINKSEEVIQCDSSNGCSFITAVTTEDTNWCKSASYVGKIKSNGKICITYNEEDSSKIKEESVTATSGKYFITVANEIFPGSSAGTILINFEGKKITPVKFNEVSYYLVADGSKGKVIATGAQQGKVYKCEQSTCTLQDEVSKTYPNYDGSSNISCDKDGKCTLATIDARKTYVYCLSATNKLQSCENDCSGTCIDIINKDGYYLPYDKDGLIQCTGESCGRASGLEQGYYKSQDISKQLVRCNTSVGKIRCDYAEANDGYYLKTGKYLIKCESNKCEDTSAYQGKWFLSGDSEYKLLNCVDSESCTGESKPKEGWYVDNDNHILISCLKKNNDIQCKKENNPRDGEYINATGENYLIHCLNGSCSGTTPLIIDDLTKYSVNGEDKKLIKCINYDCKVINNVGNWYKTNKDTSPKRVIKCDNECVEYSVSSILKGFYLNGDENKEYKPLLINDQSKVNYYNEDPEISIVNGWYVNADTSSRSMIRCNINNYTKVGINAVCLEDAFVNSCSTDSAKFVKENGNIKWCVNSDGVYLPKTDETKEVMVKVKSSNIPWISGVTGDKFAIFTITKDIISQKKVDGYYYDGKELYFCSGSGSGLCEKKVKEGGYFLDYSGHLFYRCDKTECKTIKYDKLDDTKNVYCNNANYNVIIYGECTPGEDSNPVCKDDKWAFYLCQSDNVSNEGNLDISTVNINYLYALNNKYFPTAGTSSRYILADVSKYSVIFKKTIKEVDDCPETVSPSADEKVVCLKDKKLYYKKTLLTDTNLTNAEVRKSDSTKRDIEYDYQTNNGYYKYATDQNKSVLKTVFLNEGTFKYECDIGSACVKRELGVEPITGFNLKNGVLLSKKDSETSAKEVTSKIMDGIYIDKDNENDEAIECRSGICKWFSMIAKGISFSEGKVTVGGIQGNGLYNQYLFGSSFGGLRKRDGEEYVIMNELTTVQYSEVEDKGETSNIIIDDQYHRKITNEIGINASNVKAYICTGSRCKEVSRDGDEKKYLLNSAQKGKKENAYVVCHNSKCELMNAEANLLFENYAATGSQDAHIKCTTDGCDISAVPPTHGLDECKYILKPNGNGKDKDLVKTELTGKCLRSNGEVLLDGQYCILDGTIYKSDCKDDESIGIKLFDSTYRKIDTSKISGKHFGATMYDCPSKDKCNITYGYVVGNDGYALCDTSDCLFYKETQNSNCDIAGEGAIVNEKLCIADGDSVNNDGYYTLTIRRKSDFPVTEYGDKILVQISGSGKEMTKVTGNGYLLIKSDHQLITSQENEDNNILIKCSESNSNCEVVPNPINGFYKSDKYQKIIKCVDGKCNMTDEVEEPIAGLKFSKKDEKLYYAIDSQFPGSENMKIIAEATKYSITIYRTDNYVVLNESENKLAGKSDSLKSLYICNSKIGKCEKKYTNEDISDGWYVSGQEGIKAIKCISGSCELIESLNSQCKSEGELIYSGNQYIFCGKSKEAINLSIRAGESSVFSIKNAFPNGKNYVVVNGNAVIGLGYYDEENKSTTVGIAKCNTQCKVGTKLINLGEYCINESNGVKSIYERHKESEEDTTGTCKKQFTEGVHVEVFKGNTLVTTANDATEEGNQMFYCKNGECSITAGYKKIAGNFYRCDYGKCSIASGSEPGDVSGSSIYIDADTQKTIEDDKYYIISGSHHFPGGDNLEAFVVETGGEYAVIFKGEGYYLIDSENKILAEDPADVNTEVDGTAADSDNNNELIYCSGSSKECKKIDASDIGNGYYINAAIPKEDRYKKSIISCKTGKCSIADSTSIIFEAVKKCSDEQLGKLVRSESGGKLQEYLLCNKKDSAPISVKKTDENSSYYVLTLGMNASFGDVKVTEEDDSSKIIVVEIKKDYIKQYSGLGYIIIANNGELLKSVGAAVGTLYRCESKDTDGVKCAVVAQPKNGWYFNNVFQDKRYIKYDGAKAGNYEIVPAKDATKCETSGYLIYNEGFKLCLSTSKIVSVTDEFDAVMTIPIANTFPGVTVDNKTILISVGNSAIYQMKLTTNVVAREDDIISSVGEWGRLYQCNLGECSYNEIPRDNYYLKTNKEGKNVELVYCSNRQCKSKNSGKTFTISGEEKTGVKEGFRVGASRKYPLIQCISNEKKQEDPDNPFKTESISECKERELKEGWFLSAENDGGLIKCTKEFGCEEYNVDPDESGWYINGATSFNPKKEKMTEKDVVPIIKCDAGQCTEYTETIPTTCSKVGEIISSGGYKLCTDKKSSVALSSSAITVINNEVLPGASVEYVPVKLGENRAIVAEDGNYAIGSNPTVMYGCSSGRCTAVTSENYNGAYLYENINGVLMKGTCANGACTKWDRVTTEGNYILNDSDKMVTSEDDSVRSIYECIKQNNVLKCRNMIDIIGAVGGYYITKIKINNVDTEIIYACESGGVCNIMKYEELEKCTLLPYKEGICYISYNDEPDYQTYSEVRDEPIIGPGSLCRYETKNTKDIYFAYKEINTGIDEANCVNVRTLSSSEHYMVNYLNNGISYNYEVSKYFVRSSRSYSGASEANPTCTYDFKEEKCTGKQLSAGQICTSASNRNYLIKESSGLCTNHINGRGYSYEDSDVITTYSSIGQSEKSVAIYFQVNGSMYKLNAGETNNSISKLGDGIYIIDNANKIVHIANGKTMDLTNTKYKIYVCASNVCTLKTTCGNSGINEYIYDDGRILKCDPTTNKLSYIINGDGYYVNGPWENLISCSSGTCKVIDDGMEGYYVDFGNDESIIKCIREKDKFKCASEVAVKCTYNYDSVQDISTCKAKSDNISRNSYCLYVIKDINGKINQKPKLLYVENFIKAKDTGNCVAINDSSEIFYHYRKSRFLGKEEKDEVLKVTKNAIVSLYEKDLGYYIISTETRKGIIEDTDLNKSRLYECVKNNCIELKKPVDERIYINKASDEKMVRYLEKSNSWEVIKHNCRPNVNNIEQCTLSTNIDQKEIIYKVEDNDNIKFMMSKIDITTTNIVLDTGNKEDIQSDAYLYTDRKNNRKMYLLDKSRQFFEVVNDKGYYIFKSNSEYNLKPYRSTVNVTSLDYISVYKLGNTWNPNSSIGSSDKYVLNKADRNGEGIAIQVMNIVDKETPEVDESQLRKRDEDTTTKLKMKAVINKCTSTRKNYCQNVQANQKITAGEVCVVTDGDLKGIYIAIGEGIENKSSSKANCLRYDTDATLKINDNTESYLRHGYYQLGNSNVLFAGNYYSKIIADIDENVITLFNKYSNQGYYVINEDNKQVFTVNAVKATAYKCAVYHRYYETDDLDNGIVAGQVIEGSDSYECRTVNPGNIAEGRYYRDANGRVLYYKAGNWNVVNKNSYFFFNSDDVTATINKEKDNDNKLIDVGETITYSTVSNDGFYISDSNLDRNKVVVVKRENSQSEIVVKYNVCKIISGNKCAATDATVVLNSGDACYIGGKLYVVEEVEGNDGEDNIHYCYSGNTSSIKYRYIEDVFYRLDGNSIQKVTDGIYVLNGEWSEFSSVYPEIPAHVIVCSGGSCEEVEDELDVDQEVIINEAATGNNRLMVYYPETKKFANVSKEGYYFFTSEGIVDNTATFIYNAYYVTSNGEIKKIYNCSNSEDKECVKDNNGEYTVASDYNTMNIYVNSAKPDTFIRGYNMYSDDENLKYDVNNEIISYNGNEGSDDGENVLVYVDTKLYAVRQKYLETVEDGLYILDGASPLDSEEFMEIDTDDGVCYYENSSSISSGSCDSAKLEVFKKQKYIINNATKKPSIVEYESVEGKWRRIRDDGIYFFFEDGYSIDEHNRRISSVYEIVKGEVVDITKDENRIGYYQFDGLMIESNEVEGWEDAVKLVDSVEVKDKRMCQSYELNEEINSEKFCYDSELGICIPKTVLTNDSVDQINCIFSYDHREYLFLIGDKLYSISGNAFKNIKKNGLYVVGKNSMLYEGSLENKANAYHCEDGHCQLVNDLATGYYLNMANASTESPTILYYNGDSKTWRVGTVDGNYFFNSKGYAVKDSEEVMFAYVIEENGKVITNVIDGVENGIYINSSAEDVNIIVEYKNKWQKAKEIQGCTIGDDGRTITSEGTLRTGDVCVDGRTLVLVTRGVPSTTEKRDGAEAPAQEPVEDQEPAEGQEPVEGQEQIEGKEQVEEEPEEIDDGSIVGVAADGEDVKYSYDANEKIIVKLENGNIYKMDINGYVVIDKNTSLPIESEEPVKAIAYKCTKGSCNEVSVGANVRVVNVISENLPLVKSAGSGKWSIETEVGFYFFGTNYEVLVEGGVVGSAIEVEESSSGLVQRDISSSKKLGYYVNKAAESLMIVSNDEYFWSKGTAAKKCVLATVGEGEEAVKVCRTSSEKITYDEGDLCVVDDNLYILTDEATSTGESANCVGSEDVTKYVGKDVVSAINGVSSVDYLIRMSNNGICKANNGYYYLNAKGEEVDSSEGGEVTMYSCTTEKCDIVTPEEKVKYLTEKGEIFETVEEKLQKITQPGLYFFTENNIGCAASTDKVGIIVEVTESGNEEKSIDEFEEGAYINAINNNSIGIYENGEWTIEESDCKFDATTNSCTSENQNLEVGSICVVNGTLYFVTEITGTEEAPVTNCLPGDDTNPFYFKGEDDSKYVVVKKNSIGKITEEGYYALDIEKNVALHATNTTESIFIRCNDDGECVDVDPIIKMGSYLNKAPSERNIVHFDEGTTESTVTIETKCTVDGTTCTLDGEGELNSGDLCVASGALYLIKDEGECVKTEKFVERYQFVNNKIYKLGDDVVIQMFDGYYFMNGDNRAIGSAEDYANPDTVGYMCSIKGDCVVVDPFDITYFKDYTTINDGKFRVIKYDPDRVAKRDGNSGYSSIEEDGVYKLDDGIYVECDYESNGEVSCKDIEEEVAKMTVDDVVIVCNKNEDKEIECTEAIEGGYYWIDNELYECEANEEEEKLVCEIVQKEGYFLTKSKGDLYECSEKKEEEEEEEEDDDVLAANIALDEIDDEIAGVENVEEVNEVDKVSRDDKSSEVGISNREELDDGNEGNDGNDGNEGIENNENENEEEEEEPTGTEEPTSTETADDIIPTPVDVTCKPIECSIGQVIPNGAEDKDVLYACVKVEKEKQEDGETGESQDTQIEDEEEEKKVWISKKCDSGINLKLSDDFYKCENEKEDVEKEIPKPNNDHVPTENSGTRTRTRTKSSTSTSTEAEATSTEGNDNTTTSSSSSSSTTTVSTQKEEKTTAKPSTTPTTTQKPAQETSTKTSTKPSSTTTTKSSPTQGGDSGAISRRNLPSIVFYLSLFILALFLHY